MLMVGELLNLPGKDIGKQMEEMGTAAGAAGQPGEKKFKVVINLEFEGSGLDVQQNYMAAVASNQAERDKHQARNN